MRTHSKTYAEGGYQMPLYSLVYSCIFFYLMPTASYCVVPANAYTPPQKRIEIPGGGDLKDRKL